jgi:lysine-N-methylase
LTPSNPIRSDYPDRFHCIGSACEDTCCQGWSVPVDQAAYEKYQQLSSSPLRVLIDESISVTPPGPDGPKPAHFAKIRMNSANQCPLLTADRLCGIQAEHGEALLSHTCATHPRIVHSIGGVKDTALTLSCPEAARLVLLSTDLFSSNRTEDSDGSNGGDASSNLPDFWPMRAVVLALVQNRDYPLWQRLFLLGLLCRRLDSIANGELKGTVAGFLAGFEAAVATGTLRPAMETLPIDRTAQLDAVLRLAGMMLHRSNVHPRFVECVQAFTTGIGNAPGATLESLTAQFTVAHDHYYAPFIDRHPHILENYLINTIIRCRFPYGREVKAGDGAAFPAASMTREFAKLAAQFALMKGLLIGVAGHHRESFAAEHTVHTVQAASKHFEHHPEFLDLAHQLLVESQLDGARGIAILLRNADANLSRPVLAEIHAPAPQNSPQV